MDSEGLVVEIADATASHHSYEAPHHEQTYKTGRLGVGHFSFQSADLDRLERFYVDALGLEITDYNDLNLMTGVRVRVGFYRANPRHHSAGCASFGIPSRQRLHHFFLELPDHDAVWGHRMPAAQKLRMLPTVARAAAGQLRARFSG